jgi:tetratricopeptide (TPR) repeat protein
MKTVDFSYFIERYSSGEMSDAEKLWFEKELEGNEKLRNEVNLRKRTDEVLKSQNIISLRNKLSNIEKRREVIKPVKNTGRNNYLKYAALIAALAVIGSITVFNGKKLSSDEIINRYNKTYQVPSASRSGNSSTNADFTLALEYYNTKDYERAADMFSKVVESNPKDMQWTLLNGISNFENNKYPEAKGSLGKVIDGKNNLYIDHAEWYLALCYLKTDELDKAVQLLEAIKNEDGIYKTDARKILRKLK